MRVLRGALSNLWLQPIDGTPGHQLTDFDALQIRDFHWSFDGKQLGLVRGRTDSDVGPYPRSGAVKARPTGVSANGCPSGRSFDADGLLCVLSSPFFATCAVDSLNRLIAPCTIPLNWNDLYLGD